MGSETSNPEFKQWKIEEIVRGDDIDVSIEVYLGLYEHYNRVGQFRFQYNRGEDGVGPIYIPGRWGSSFDDKDADRDNQAAFEAARAVAEETGTRVEMYVHSQEYLDTVSRESLSNLIGKVGEERAREILKEETEE
ncbi:hypothetical protein [Halovivax gelatinilyticus]|uniref:hypothetical protein n=1 Tax=Halovivax gelatinilyticus TaxID=2961597 RepID=UPI0020CA5259|nr:hypothetical protein [Halovivax gelatinilyticus]